VECEPLLLHRISPAHEIKDSPCEYKIVVPLPGIERRNVYVFAAPYTISLEIRMKATVEHSSEETRVAERTDQRICREFRFGTQIQARSTKIQFDGDCIQITATKSNLEQQETWSEFVQFTT